MTDLEILAGAATRNEFEILSDQECMRRWMEKNRVYSRQRRKEAGPKYAASLLAHRSALSSVEIPKALAEAKSMEIQLKRKLKYEERG